MKLRVNELLLDSKRSHTGKNRTAYGKIAGYYCDAFCQFQVGLQEHNREKKREYFLNSLHLTQKASERVGTYSCLALSKISGLAIRVARKLQALGMRIDNREFVDAHKKAKKSLKKRGYNFLDNIPCDRWLATPLN